MGQADVLQVIVPISTSLPTPPRIDDPVSPSSKPLCPICLSEPSAPRMTRCGHVFCYPCLLHYLEVGEEAKSQGRKCPVCTDVVLRKDLKSVRWNDAAAEALSHGTGDVVVEGPDQMTFRLIQRPDITTLALPRSATWPSDAIDLHQAPWHFVPDAAAFAKTVLASPAYMDAELRRDLVELDAEAASLSRWASGEDDLGLVFVRAAQRKVHEQLEKVALLKTHAVMTARKRVIRDVAAVEGAKPVVAHEPTTTDEETDAGAPFVLEPADPRAKPRRNVNPPAPSEAMYYFYQASSGQQIYLHPLDIRILKSHFGNYSSFPDTITLPVEGHEDSTMTDELRRKCRYLGHLPTACDVVFVETKLDSLVGAKGLEPFAQALKQRRTRRKEKVKREDKAKAKSEQRDRDNALANVPVAPRRRPSVSVEAPEPPESPTGSPSSQPLTGPRTVWGTPAVSWSTAASHQPADDPDDDGYDDAWAEFEEDVVLNGSQRPWAKGRGQNGGGSPVAAGGGGAATPEGGRKKGRKKKIVLSLSGGAMRGA